MTSNLKRYQQIAPFYDLIDSPFEARRYRALRPLLFDRLAGRLLDAGVGTGRTSPSIRPAAASSALISARRCWRGLSAGEPNRVPQSN